MSSAARSASVKAWDRYPRLYHVSSGRNLSHSAATAEELKWKNPEGDLKQSFTGQRIGRQKDFMSDHKRYRFDRFIVDSATKELLELQRDSSKAFPLTLRPQAFDLLVYLIRNRHEAVLKSKAWEAIPKTLGKTEEQYDPAVVDQAFWICGGFWRTTQRILFILRARDPGF
jgi:hypothetical protein